MKIVQLSNCKMDLNFSPCRDWPKELPAIVCDGFVIAGFEATEGVEISGSLVDLIAGIYGNLTLPELSRLWVCLKRVNCTEGFSALAEKTGLRFSDQLVSLMEAIAALHLNWQNLLSEKNLSPRELSPLLCKAPASIYNELFGILRDLQASRNHIAQALELVTELELMGEHRWRAFHLKLDPWIEWLKSLRHPITSELTERLQDRFALLSWPNSIQHSIKRDSDAATLQIQFKVQSDRQLQSAIEGLSRIQKQAAEKELWKPSQYQTH